MMAPSDGRGLDDGAERGLEVFQEGGRLVARQAGWGMMEQSSLLGDTPPPLTKAICCRERRKKEKISLYQSFKSVLLIAL